MASAPAPVRPVIPAEQARRWPAAAVPEFALLSLCIVRFWLMPLPSSLWTDEAATAFTARFPHDPSLAIVSPYTQSIYYLLPRAMDRLFGFSELAYRIPSVLAMALALWFLARLVTRVVHADAAWFSVFAFLAIPSVNYFAGDAKPYALGFCVALGALYFEARWLDSGRWRHAAPFLVFGALVWRVHQVYWPFYIVVGIYACARLLRREGPATLRHIAGVFSLLALMLMPVALDSLRLLREAGTHVIVMPPHLVDLWTLFGPERNLIAIVGALAWLSGKFCGWQLPATPRVSAIVLAVSCWLVTPVTVYLFSIHSAVSLFVPRYLSLHLAGAALCITMAAALYIPRASWRPLTLALGTGVLLTAGAWLPRWPDHDPARWRDAAQYVNSISTGPRMPAFCTSPYIEAAPPVWRPDYHLPGFLYSPLFAYPLRAKPYLLPFDDGVGPFHPAREAVDYVSEVAASDLPRTSRFVIYGGAGSVIDWTGWMANHLRDQAWRIESYDAGDIRVSVFTRAH